LAAGFIPFFLFARFSFGYVVGISFYSLITGFVWISHFSNLNYDHDQARRSAILSLLMFLLPALFQTIPIRSVLILSPRSMNRLLISLLCLTVVILLLNGHYGVAFVGIHEAEELRSAFVRPAILNYITGSFIGAVLPFSFAYFALDRRYGVATIAILLIVSFYPVLLNKTVLLAAAWLPFLFCMFRAFDPKRATVLSLLIPMAAGLVFNAFAPSDGSIGSLASSLYGVANVRMFAIPSIAMNYYSEFFANNVLTHYCQINLVRIITGCPYANQLGVVLAEQYGAGNLNASLFATEGVASVGTTWAPISAVCCGIIVSAGNSISARLPAPVVAVSAGLVVEALLNVPLSTCFLSNGLFVLFLLWYVTPALERPGESLPVVAREGRRRQRIFNFKRWIARGLFWWHCECHCR